MKKRRIASTRHMSKDDKRRLQLNKRLNNNKEEKHRNFRDAQCKECESKRHKKYRKDTPKRSDLEKHLAILVNGCKSRLNHSKSKSYRGITLEIDYKFLGMSNINQLMSIYKSKTHKKHKLIIKERL